MLSREANKKFKELKRIINTLYGWDSDKILNTNEVFELLLKADEIHDQIRREIAITDYDREKANSIRELLDASRIVGFRCDSKSFITFQDLLNNYRFFDINLIPYLKVKSAEHFRLCESKMESNLRENVNKLSSIEQDNIAVLMFEILTSDLKYFNGKTDQLNAIAKSAYDRKVINFEIPEEHLKEGLLVFLEFEAGPLDIEENVNKKKGFKVYKRKFEDLVIKLCKNIDKLIGEIVDVYLNLIYDKQFVGKFDEFVIEWVTNGKVCKRILRHDDILIRETHKLLLQRSLANSRMFKKMRTDFKIGSEKKRLNKILKYLPRKTKSI